MTSPKRRTLLTRDFLIRVLSAAVVGPIFLAGAIVGGTLWAVILAPVAAIGTLEFMMLAKGRKEQGSPVVGVVLALGVLLGVYKEQPPVYFLCLLAAGLATVVVWGLLRGRGLKTAALSTLMTLAGVLYVGFPVAFLFALRAEGGVWLALVLAGTWGTDTFAYIGGVTLGKHKLAPRLSPKKTVEGAVIGVIGGFLVALAILVYDGRVEAATLVIIALTPPIAVLGDLAESMLKRYYGVKDSHLPHLNVMPGHGGVLDRIDALLVVSAFYYAALLVSGVAG